MFSKPGGAPDPDDKKPDIEEISDDSDDQEDDASEDTDEGEDKEDKEEKEKPNLFFDPNKIPPELQGPFKAMQASFTRKMQKASLGVKKAEAFDELLQTPQFHSWMEAFRAGRLGPDGLPARSVRRLNKATEDDEEGDEKPDSVRALIREEISKSLRPQEAARAMDNARKEFEQFKVGFPQYVNYQEDMKEVLDKNPGLSFEQAFRIASFEDATSEGSRKALKVLSGKKRANISKDEGGEIPERTPKKAKTILEAYDQAKKDFPSRR